MKTLFCWIDTDWIRDISKDHRNFQIYRTVIWTDETLNDKQNALKQIPFCTVLDSLEMELKGRVNWILD